MMKIINEKIFKETSSETDVIDITPEIEKLIDSSSISNGCVCVHIPGSTASISTIEFEPGAIADFKRILEKLIPRDENYKHNETWNDGNGYSHIRSTILGSSKTFPIHDKVIQLGTWQQIVLIDFDNKSRNREINIQVIGE
ncbi:MAG: secondary thiamine-phosphate synthase enzyme YjbQ [Pseudomonadota bacterium]